MTVSLSWFPYDQRRQFKHLFPFFFLFLFNRLYLYTTDGHSLSNVASDADCMLNIYKWYIKHIGAVNRSLQRKRKGKEDKKEEECKEREKKCKGGRKREELRRRSKRKRWIKGDVHPATLSEPGFFVLFTILKVNVYISIININHLLYANFSSIICWIKMTIFIIFSQ